MSDPPKSLFGDGGKIVVPVPKPKHKEIAASEVAVTKVNTKETVVSESAIVKAKIVSEVNETNADAKLEYMVNDYIGFLNHWGYTSAAVGPNPCNWPCSKLFMSYSDDFLEATNSLPDLPTELVGEIGRELSIEELNNVRLVNMRFNKAVKFEYGKKVSVTESVTIFPTFSSVAAFLIGLRLDGAYAGTVRKITLVGEGPKTPEMSYDIAWLHLMSDHPDPNRSTTTFTRMNRSILNSSEYIEAQKVAEADLHLVEDVNDMHSKWAFVNKPFTISGGYRMMLSIALSKLPNLKTIATRKLRVGEHIPGWAGAKALKGLSYYRSDLPINKVYYGDWQYDTVHKRVTMYTDEYGEYIEEEDAGPQASFIDDVIGAMKMSGTRATLV